MPPEIDALALVLLVLAGLTAGWVDAVVGRRRPHPAAGAAPHAGPDAAAGAGHEQGRLHHGHLDQRPDLLPAGGPGPAHRRPDGVAAFLAAVGGAAVASHIPAAAFTPIILVACVAVGAWTLARPALGRTTALRWEGHRHIGAALGLGLLIGGYDGVLGPGTGSFLVIALVGVLGYAFLPASAIAKIVNFATNLGALVFFVPHGAVVWSLGLVVGTANLVGAYIGARMAVARGSAFVRVIFVLVVGALVVRLGWQTAAPVLELSRNRPPRPRPRRPAGRPDVASTIRIRR